jgi:hypothetical protein
MRVHFGLTISVGTATPAADLPVLDESAPGRTARSVNELRSELDALFATGTPVSVRRVQRELRVGAARARTLIAARTDDTTAGGAA